ncbi:MAG: ADOP family duplicated permease [Acidobacteriota bacterium]
MSGDWLLRISDRYFRLLLRLYPADFRHELGQAFVETYRDRAREALARRGMSGLTGIWIRALSDSLRNGPGERGSPTSPWRRRALGRDAELAVRRLVRAPALVAAVVATLTVGLGTLAVVYTAVQKVLIAPMPYDDPDDLYFVWRDYGPMFELTRGWLAGPDVAELQKAGGVIEAAVGLGRQLTTVAAREGGEPAEIAVIVTTPNLFDVLGTAPVLGRGFAADEIGPKRAPVVVLTHELWTRMGASVSLVGTDVRLNGEPYTVIGVMPPSFAFMRHASLGAPQGADAYITFAVNLPDTSPNAGSNAGLIRARRGASPQEVATAVDVVGETVDARDFRGRGLELYPVGLKPDLVEEIRPALVALGLAGVFLTLVLIAILGSVLLARAAQREQEFAVSRALGANGLAVVRATLFEGTMLGLFGGAAGALAAFWATRALVALAPLDLPRREAVAVDWQIAATIVAGGGLIGLVAATAPAVWAGRMSLSAMLSASAVRGGGGQGRLRRGMVVAQVALSIVLLGAGGLVVRSFDRLLRADPGFRPEGVLTLRVPMPVQLFPKDEEVQALQTRLHDALAAVPGVTGVSATAALPLTASANQSAIRIPGAPGNTGDADKDAPLVDYIGVRAGYFDVMGMRVVAGRAFDQVRREGIREALIDRLLAAQFFPGRSPLGATIPFGEKTELTIVGVVEQARQYDVDRDGRPQLFLRAEDWRYRSLSFVLRTERDPRGLMPEARAVVRQIEPRLAVANVQTLEDLVGDALRQQRVSAVLIAGFALGALLLAAMGLFGVVSASVTRRRHELAVRLALGADHRGILRLVIADGGRLVALGVLVGLPGVYAMGGLMHGVLVGVSRTDPPTLIAVALGLGLVSLAACYVPARRVLAIDPAQSLRHN